MRTTIFAALLLVPLLACDADKRVAPSAPPAEVEAKTTHKTEPAGPPQEGLDALEGKVLLVTHPRTHVLRSLQAMVETGALSVQGLRVVGLYHAAEEEGYDGIKTFVQLQRLPWLGLKRIDCRINADQVFGENACTPVFASLFERAAGIVFTGGADIPPALYGQKTKLLTVIRTPRRHWWELSFLAHLLGGPRMGGRKPLLDRRPDLPVLGICLGMQSMNVAAGGTLHQDILSDLYRVRTYEEAEQLDPARIHRSVAHALHPGPAVYSGVYHPIRLMKAPKLWGRLAPGQEPVKVMSIHHQALDRLGPGLEVIASSMDGKVAEAVRHKKYPNVLAVQFHPEYHFLDQALLRGARLAARGPRGKRPSPPELTATPLLGDARSVAFHRKFWQVFGQRLSAPDDAQAR